MQLTQASFFWKNNEPGGIGFSFNIRNGFSPEMLSETFFGPTWKNYARSTAESLGTGNVNDYFQQLNALSQARTQNKPIPVEQAVIGALNIYWLTSWGFLPNNEFNGYQFMAMGEV